jgi:hypothetical protein
MSLCVGTLVVFSDWLCEIASEDQMLSTKDRVPSNTAAQLNRRVQAEILNRVRYYSGNRSEIPKRLRELENEWDIERAIEANAATLALLGVVLGARNRRWLTLPMLVSGFLLQHAVQGWCPPVPILRQLGFRTSYEIEEERQALKALRGDFDDIKTAPDQPQAAVAAAHR